MEDPNVYKENTLLFSLRFLFSYAIWPLLGSLEPYLPRKM